MRRLAIVSLLVSLAPTQALAWGSEGHRIIAEIAEQYLTPEAAHQVRDLLAIEGDTTLADVANWADQIRHQRPETAPWHFVDIPISAPRYDPARDCRQGDCVVAKIEQFEATLADKRASQRDRLEALKFVVHFVGDLHQPLHASDNNDKGRNEVHVTFEGRHTNLHAVWDTYILEPAVNDGERGYAQQLTSHITATDVARWQHGKPEDWANEAHQVAVSVIYGILQHDEGRLPESYERYALPVVNKQLERAGVRLAFVLNQTLG